MNQSSTFVCCGVVALFVAAADRAGAAVSSKDARVTQVIRDVKLLPSGDAPRAATVNDQVREGIGVRTGDQSRSELTFADLTISRLGANTVFAFNSGGRSVQLDGGSVLVRVPKGSGGGNVRTNAVSVGITGTTLILETTRAGRSKLIVLEGSTRLSLVKYRDQVREVRGGQMLDVPAGATTLPMPQNIDLNQVMRTHPLIVGFRPLPSRDLIIATAQNPPGPNDEPVYQGRPVGGAPVVSGGFPFPNVGLPPIVPGRNDPRPPPAGNPTTPPGTNTPGSGTVGGKRGPSSPPIPSTGQTVGNAPQPSSGGSGPITRRPPVRRVPSPRSTPPPIR